MANPNPSPETRFKAGESGNASGLSKSVREFHAAFRERLPKVFVILDRWLDSNDPELQEKAVQFVCKYGVPVPQMKGGERENPDNGLGGIDAAKLRAILAAIRTH